MVASGRLKTTYSSARLLLIRIEGSGFVVEAFPTV
jgi:hypothetical protein